MADLMHDLLRCVYSINLPPDDGWMRALKGEKSRPRNVKEIDKSASGLQSIHI